MYSNLHPFLFLICLLIAVTGLQGQDIPLAEHPRPDFERPDWINLNGDWAFEFDEKDVGIQEDWSEGKKAFSSTIKVPFPWGSKLSQVEDGADIGWYQRSIQVEPSWQTKRTFLTIGASDWETSVWLDGIFVGSHQGGYVPFSFELTDLLKYGSPQQLVIRVDDKRREFTLYGKQGYGNARGIWQTVYLESRGNAYLDALHFTPNIEEGKVQVTAYLPKPATADLNLILAIQQPESGPSTHTHTIPAGKKRVDFTIELGKTRLWTLEDPYLYEVAATLGDDQLKTYFGMRKISVMNLPGTDYPYIALNNEPIYVQMALDQSYHPEGFYTFPSDQFMKEEIERSKSIGLNGIRVHIKLEVPRKLYWADKLGLLVMEDVPNSWGEPDEDMREETEYTLREMIKRDYNHPSIFSWVIFNETWGLRTKVNADEKPVYLPQTQNWVASMYYLAKSLDPSRLVEDNSICCGAGHTETDINSWHVYLPGWEWDKYLKNISTLTYEGSTFHFENGFQQGNQPNINSECGNVWGYEGSTGDVDWSWDYHRMINAFRKYPKIGGWLYTEHHDVINEWNGYWRFDRSEKETGIGEIVSGMKLNDFHAPVYLSTGQDICLDAKGGEIISVPLYLSCMTGEKLSDELTIEFKLSHLNAIGEWSSISEWTQKVAYTPWMQKELESIQVKMPNLPGLAKLETQVLDSEETVLHRNFMHFDVASTQTIPSVETVSVPADKFTAATWSGKQWNVREGRKVNGTGKGFFEYTFEIPKGVKLGKAKEAYLLFEVSSKELLVKDQVAFDKNQDYMKGSKVFPSSNPNSYPMTDTHKFPSIIQIWINGQLASTETLKDDPADHRGVLSWHHQLQNKRLEEAGSYGFLVKVTLTERMLRVGEGKGNFQVQLRTNQEGGIAVYGKEFGRFPLDPSLVIKY